MQKDHVHAADGLYMSCLSRPEWAMNVKSCRWRSDGMAGRNADGAPRLRGPVAKVLIFDNP